MRVALNGVPLLSPLTGIGRYVHELLHALIRRDGLSLEMFYGTHWSHQIKQPMGAGVRSKIRPIIRSTIPCAFELNRLVSQYFFSKKTNKERFDLYHEPNFLSFNFDGPIVLTVHDLSWIRHPETHPLERVRAMHKYFEPSLNAAQSIISISEFVTQELLSTFSIERSKIVKIYPGVSSDFRPINKSSALSTLNKFNLKHGRYFLLVGTLEPRKNLQIALDAFLKLPKKMREIYPLVIVGMKGWKMAGFDKEILSLTLSGEVKILGYLPQSDLTHITAGALVQLYPSLYEGFGLPPWKQWHRVCP